jgi:hypothetical protein
MGVAERERMRHRLDGQPERGQRDPVVDQALTFDNGNYALRHAQPVITDAAATASVGATAAANASGGGKTASGTSPGSVDASSPALREASATRR